MGGLRRWQADGHRALKRITMLIGNIARNGNEGIGKPEAFKHRLWGYFSRRITDEHRLVYKVVSQATRITRCRYRYGR